MPSRVLLISANRCTAPDPVFPLGLACLSAALRRAGHQCIWLDALVDAESFAEKLKASRPDFVGISLRNIDDVLIRKQETYFNTLPTLVVALRQALPCPIIIGGSGFSIFPQQLLERSGADFGIVGEGETTLLSLLSALETCSDYRSIPGLAFRQHDHVVVNPPVFGSLDRELELPDLPANLTTHYLRAGSMLNIQTQRGCAFRCCYCTYPVIEGRLHRRRPAEVVAADFEQLQRHGARYVFIVDSVFNSSPRHVEEVCEAILKRNLKLSWGCFLRPQGLTSELMRLMARAGLAHIEFGSDSFCDDVLTSYGKDFTFEDIHRSSEYARESGVDFCHFLIAGGPGETYETMERGFANSMKLNAAIIMAVVGMRIYPGTRLFDQALVEGRIHQDSDLLKPSYYIAPGLTAESIFAQLRRFADRSPNWIVGDPPPAYQTFVRRLRQRGVAGPLWSYFSMIQRLWPRGVEAKSAA